MSEAFRLVFAGEIVEGQHAAVVKKRLAGLLKLTDERMDVLFSGKPVVVKKRTDEKTAVRYTQAFKKAGAKLRVLPVEGGDGQPSAPAVPANQPSAAANQPTEPSTPGSESARPADDSGLSLLPAGADILTQAERDANDPEPVQVSVDHLEVLEGSVDAVAEQILAELPEVDHLSLAEVGVQLSDPSAFESVVMDEIETDFDLAAPGAMLGTETREEGPPPPDTGHLSLVPESPKDEENS